MQCSLRWVLIWEAAGGTFDRAAVVACDAISCKSTVWEYCVSDKLLSTAWPGDVQRQAFVLLLIEHGGCRRHSTDMH